MNMVTKSENEDLAAFVSKFVEGFLKDYNIIWFKKCFMWMDRVTQLA